MVVDSQHHQQHHQGPLYSIAKLKLVRGAYTTHALGGMGSQEWAPRTDTHS